MTRVFDDSTRMRPGPAGSLAADRRSMLRHAPSGDLFGWSQNVGMGWEPAKLDGKQFLILSTQGGIRARGRHARSRSAIIPGTGKSAC